MMEEAIMAKREVNGVKKCYRTLMKKSKSSQISSWN